MRPPSEIGAPPCEPSSSAVRRSLSSRKRAIVTLPLGSSLTDARTDCQELNGIAYAAAGASEAIAQQRLGARAARQRQQQREEEAGHRMPSSAAGGPAGMETATGAACAAAVVGGCWACGEAAASSRPCIGSVPAVVAAA